MSASKMGAKVMYCGHQGWFIADIHRVAGANVVVANGPVTSSNIIRKNLSQATHHVEDFPLAGYWAPHRGIFVVPEDQVTEIK